MLNSTKKSLGSEGFSFGALTRNDYIIIFLLHHVIIKRLILWGDYAVQHFASVLCLYICTPCIALYTIGGHSNQWNKRMAVSFPTRRMCSFM